MMPFIPSWLDDAGLSPRAFRVLAHLWRRRNRKTRQCNPSAASIATACGIKDNNTVWKVITEIEKAGLLKREKHGFRASNQYTLIVPTTRKSPVIDGPQLPEKTDHQLPGLTHHQLYGKTHHQGYPLKGIKEGEREADSLSAFDGIVRVVELMPEFQDRTDVRSIAQIIGRHKLRNSAHLAQRVRDERNPRYKPRSTAAVQPEPTGWLDWLKANMPTESDPAHSQLQGAKGCQKWTYVPASWQEKCRKRMGSSER